MEYSKLPLAVCLCLVVHASFAQRSSGYGHRTYKVQLEDIEQGSLKNSQRTSSRQASQSPQYTQDSNENQQQLYYVPQQTVQQQATVPSTRQQASAVPAQSPSQPQRFIYYVPQQQFSPYEVSPYVPIFPSANAQLNDYYKLLQQQQQQPPTYLKTAAGSVQSVKPAAATAGSQFPTNYYLPSGLSQTYFPAYTLASRESYPQYFEFNSLYQLPLESAVAGQKSVYSSGIKSTTAAAPAKNVVEPGPSRHGFEYTRVTG